MQKLDETFANAFDGPGRLYVKQNPKPNEKVGSRMPIAVKACQ